ncbi:MAG TPA: MarR family transcriptional regulator, partial [Candidatus Altiarchaeales archaeon]|nr:MarR family transcriptional regulator [Candidatus Altiarchaeales archaeon]
PVLTGRQKDIFQLISDSKEPVNQSVICEKLGLPKSSVSRNIDALVKKGLVEKHPAGMSTLLKPKKQE